jgi:hypothetical protein
MKAKVIATVYTKGESANAVKKVIVGNTDYFAALEAAGNMAKILLFTGWYCSTCANLNALTHCDYENGVKFENYSNEVLFLKLVANK